MSILAIWRAATLLQRIGASIGLVLILVGAWKLFWWQHDRGVIAEHEAEITAQVIEASASASVAALEAAASTKAEVEAVNAKARAAAAKSDDPLRDGLKALGK